MSSLRVFWGAPTSTELQSAHSSSRYTWRDLQPAPAALESLSYYENAINDDSQQDGYRSYGDMTRQSKLNLQVLPYLGRVPSCVTIVKRRLTGVDIDDTKFSAAPRNSNMTISFLNSTTGAPGQSYYDETIETQGSFNLDEENSIARFPSFSFSLHAITPLSALNSQGAAPRKVNVLLAVLEVEGPDAITIKKGNDAGKEVSVIKFILGDDKGGVCKLTGWREVADTWGNQGVKRGDIVYIQNVTPAVAPNAAPTLTASPFLKSALEICYRTLAYGLEDARYRPDLRLGDSDASIRKVSELVRWFEQVAGMRP